MSIAPFFVGVATAGAAYGSVKYRLHQRENVVFYSVDQIKESFQGHTAKVNERYVPLRSREHEFYTYMRQGWNSRVYALRDATYDFFKSK